jgi:hypothetical protein
MSTIVVLCEGDTEELAVRHFLQKRWQQDGLKSVGLQAINLNGKLQDVGPKARLYLDECDVLAVFTLIDLYGMDRVVHQPGEAVGDKVGRVQQWLRGTLKHDRAAEFSPHLGVHETEAWLLAEGAALARRLGGPGIQPDPHAEMRDFQRPPSRLINDMFLSRRSGDRSHKIRDGRSLFAAMQFDPLYQACRHFRSFYDDLKSVAFKHSRPATI